RPQGRVAIGARTRKWCGPRALYMYIDQLIIDGEFTGQNGAAITQQRSITAKLVAGICLGNRRRGVGKLMSEQEVDSLIGGQPLGVESEFTGQLMVEHNQFWLGGGGGCGGFDEFGEDLSVIRGQVGQAAHIRS